MDEYFERCSKGPPFKDNEDKKYEFSRLLSFSNWPEDCPVFPLKLAKAGFYFSGNGDEVKCFRCSVVKSEWQPDDDPTEIHRLLNPTCPFLVGDNEELNIPFGRNVPSNEDSSLIQRLNSVIEGRDETVENETSNTGVIGETGANREISNQGRTVGRDTRLNDASSGEQTEVPAASQQQGFVSSSDERSSESPESIVLRSRSLGTLQDTASIGSQNEALPESRSSTFLDTYSRRNENLADSAVSIDSASAVSRNSSESKSKADKKKEKSAKKSKEKKDKKAAKTAKTSGSNRRGSESNTAPQRGHDILPPTGEGIGPLRFERNRLETFNNWPSNACVPATELAKSGFYYTGSGDRVQCIFCKGVLRNWEEGDRPHIEHRKHFPRCPLVLGLKMGNVPLPLDHSPTSTSSGSSVGSGRQQSNVATNVADSLSNMENLGIVTDRPKHPQYAIESQRLASFQGWPPYKHQTPQLLAEAGFWYAGFNDNVKCFYCDGGLRNWEPGDEPWKEHARWFPKCPYVLQVKGQEFINSVLKEKGVEVPANTQEPGAASLNSEQIRGKYRIEEREIRARMDSPNIKKILELGISRNVVMNTLRKRLRETGDDFPSITTLMEAVYKEEAEESRRQSQNPPQSQNEPQSQDAPQSQNATGYQNASADQTASVDIAEVKKPNGEGTANQDEKIGKKNKEDVAGKSDTAEDMKSSSGIHVQADDLMKENLELKEQRLCKICMVSDANVVFLPCGHLVSCAACAPALQLCPICRASIKGTVRTYIA